MTSENQQTSTHARRRRSRGFSLLELLVAMMIMGILGVIAFKQFNKQSAKARHMRALDACMSVSKGLDQYFMKHGKYPDLASWDAMVNASSPLVKENLLVPNMMPKDPWDQDFEAKVDKTGYVIKCLGDPANQDEAGLIQLEPGKLPVVNGQVGGAQAAPAQGGGTPK